MGNLFGIITTIIVFLIVLAPLVYLAIKIVREYQRLVVFRLGRCIGQKGPGLVFLIPFVDRPVWADLRELFLEIPKQTCITKDNAPIDIDFLIFWKVVDAVTTVVQVQSEPWTAISTSEPLRAGEAIEVVGADGLRLTVRRPGPKKE